MAERSGRYWFVGFLLTLVGVWGGWSPASRAEASEPAPNVAAKGDAKPKIVGKAAPAPAESASSPPAAVDPCAHGLELIREYLALYAPGEVDAERDWLSRADYMLALVPDPELPEQAHTLGSVLEGVEAALTEDGKLVRDREWLPWSSEAKGCAERAPGVLLFRSQEPGVLPPRIVLLVAETPTWGVHRAPLAAALELVRQASDDEPLKVLGPTFSGSAASLAALLKGAARRDGLSFRFASGTATSPRLQDILGAPPDELLSIVPNDEQLLNAMRAYLDLRSASGDKLAILSEASTTYGSSVNREAERAPGANRYATEIIPLRFPVDLQPLREAVAAAPLPAGSSTPRALPAEDPHALVLDEVARDLSREGVRFVGVVATNPSDVVLLTRRLRAQLPDARFFTLGGDISFNGASLVGALNGMLVAHAKSPSEGASGSVSLKSEVVRGVFLAGRSLLEPGEAWPPPVAQISMIGNGALWEIGDEHPERKAPRSLRVVSSIALLLFGLVLFACIWPWLGRLFPRFSQPSLTRQRGPVTLVVGPCERPDLDADDALVTAALLSVVAGAVLLLFIAEYARAAPQAGLMCGVGAFVALTACWSRVIYLAVTGGLDAARISAKVCSLLGLFATVLALGIGCAPPHEATLNLLSGGSGVLAGLIGFGMLAIGLWCWRVRLRFLDTHRFGRGSRSDEPPLAEALGEVAGNGTGFFELERQLLDVIHSPWGALRAIPLAIHALLLLSVLLVYGIRPPTAFEPGWRNQLVIGFGLLALLPITVNFSRIVATWLVLSRLLKRLRLLPIVERLRKLPLELRRNLEAQLTVPNADLTELSRPVALLSSIGAAFPTLPLKAAETQAAWHAALRHQAGSSGSGDVVAEHGELLNKLLEASKELRKSRADFHDSELAELADDYLALLVAIFIPRYLRHFRLYVIPVLVGSVLGVLMTSLYFVQPQRLITSLIFVWVAAMVLLSFLIYTSFDRSAIISAIGNTTEGSVDFDWTLVSRILTWGVVPLLSLFAAQAPSFSSWISLLVNGLGTALR